MLSVKEVAKIINVEPQTVRNYIRKGVNRKKESLQPGSIANKEKLKAIQVKVGLANQWRIKQSDLKYFREKYLI